MTTIPTSTYGIGGAGSNRLSDLYTSATKNLLAQNPGLKSIDAQLKRDDARLSGLGKLALALDDFKTLAGNLAASRIDMAASSSGKAVEARLAGGTATAGVHTVEVRQLAQGQQLASKALPAKDTAIGGGGATVIKIDSGSGANASSATIRIDSTNNTLDGITQAMRDAGFDAKVVQDGKGYALNLTGKSGAGNGMRISVSGDPALQGFLSYAPGGSNAMTQKAAAQDAQLTIDGKAVTSSTNKLETAIAGVSLSFSAAGKSEVKVSQDPSAIAQNVKGFVAAFNTMNTKVANMRGSDTDTDATITQLQAQFRQVLGGLDAGGLSAMGIGSRNGALALDEEKLKAAIAQDAGKVTQLFGKEGTGLASQLATRVGQQMTAGGLLANRAAAVRQDVDKLLDKKAGVVEAVNRQASMLVQQYALAGMGGSLFGSGQANTMSAFDFLA